MAFRLPANLQVGQQYTAVSPSDVSALEEALPADSRILVGLVFAERYEGFEADCERAEAALQGQTGLYTWPELDHFITPDENGAAVAWVSYQSSPAWWMILLAILGGIFILPIITVLPVWITEKILPGLGGIIDIAVLVGLGLMMFYMVKEFTPVAKEVAPELVKAKVAPKLIERGY